MAKSVIAYDKELPEIPGRMPWLAPDSHLVKDASALSGWRVANGRRPSHLLLVPKLREQVAGWRDAGYPGASEVTLRLFEYWFDEDHAVSGFNVPFKYHFCQREAIETLAWLVEINGERDLKKLIRAFATIVKRDLVTDNVAFQTTMDGRRQIRRWVPEQNREGLQDLPPTDLARYAFKMATGSGKTWVMAMAIVWAYFHKRRIKGSPLSTNFLIVAPNVIVYQRLERDFASNKIFHELPLIPPEWAGAFSQKVILRGEAAEPDPSGNLFLTNIQQLYASRDAAWTPKNAIEAMLGPKPAKDLPASGQRSMLERLKTLKDLVVINDEAHHVHDEDLEWTKSLLALQGALPHGLSVWLDFSATPKDQNGMYFPWTVCDYPLAQAVEDRIVKAPLIVTKEDDAKQPKEDPDGITRDNVCEKYGYWLRAAVLRWREHHKVYKHLHTRPVLFIMAEKSVFADAIGEYLWKTKEFGLKESEVLVIHTDTKGEITQKDLEKAREAARDVDSRSSKVKAIVSVMMLREGWDVRNVSIVLGLRAFTAKAEILPEQVIGRGLRLMTSIGPDRTQTLEVLGTRNLLKLLRDQLESEGVGVGTSRKDPVQPVIIQPVKEKLEHDIVIPITKPRLEHDIRKLSDLKIANLKAIYESVALDERFAVRLKMDFATTQTEVHQADVAAGALPDARKLLASITNKVINGARLPNRFAELYPAVRDYVTKRCFGKRIDVDAEVIRSHLARIELQEGIAKYLAHEIGKLTIERKQIEFDHANHLLSDTKPFSWRRDLPPLKAGKTIFNFVATYNSFERKFAVFLGEAKDVVHFAALGTTEQGDSGSQFKVDYLKPSGAIGFYFPDWVVVQKTPAGLVHWIIETKGRVWEGTESKDDAMRRWCADISAATKKTWRFVRVNQSEFDASVGTLEAVVRQKARTKLV